MLEVLDLSAGYGDIIAVRDLSFSVNRGEILALLGANGAGKTTTLMTLVGLVTQTSGSVLLDGQDISMVPVEKRISLGLSIIPEGRRIFPDLSVEENLMVGGHVVTKAVLKRGMERAFDLFPRLGERKTQSAGSLSGGEQQMLAMSRALMSEPKLLLVDELSLGLMPKFVDECYRVLVELKKDGIAIVLVEQNTERALNAADYVQVLEAGNSTWSGSAIQARESTVLADAFLVK